MNIDATAVHRKDFRLDVVAFIGALDRTKRSPVVYIAHKSSSPCSTPGKTCSWRVASGLLVVVSQYQRGRWARVSQRAALSELATSSVPSHGQAQRSARREGNDESLCHVDETERHHGNAGKCEQSRARPRPVSILGESALHRARKISRDNRRVRDVSALDRRHGQCRRVRTAPSG